MFDDASTKFAFPEFTKKDTIAILTIFIGLIVSFSGFFILWQDSSQSETILQSPQSDANEVAIAIAIDVGGAIKKPGIYLLKEGDRVSQAIELAGGFSDSADPYFIAHNLNLAKTITDEEKIYIPFKGEGTDQKVTNNTANEDSEQLISINTATLAELDSLEGIGEKRAEAIMAARPYTATNELVTKNVISSSLFESIEKSIKL